MAVRLHVPIPDSIPRAASDGREVQTEIAPKGPSLGFHKLSAELLGNFTLGVLDPINSKFFILRDFQNFMHLIFGERKALKGTDFCERFVLDVVLDSESN